MAVTTNITPPKEEFMQRLIGETETACDELLVEAARAPNPPPMPPTAVKRLAELGAAAKT